eukprot:4290101-Pyramimonas_sp.AAC.1
MADYSAAGHLGIQSGEDVPSENGRNTSAQGAPEPRVARRSLADVAGQPWGRASLGSELRGCLNR